MKNEFEIRGDVTAIFINSPKFGRMETMISTDKLEKVMSHCNMWFAQYNHKTKSFYAVANMTTIDGKRTIIRLSRFVTDAQKGTQVDHINHDTLDNTDSNIRVVSQSENQQNVIGARRHSKSGVRGVSWCKRNKKWRCVIYVNKKQIRLGYFASLEDADKAAKEARKVYMPFSLEALAN